MQHGFVKVAATTPEIHVADPVYNYEKILERIKTAAGKGAKVIVLPQLCFTGTSCSDLFFQEILIVKSKL